MTVHHLPNRGWNAHAALEFVKENTIIDGKLFIVYEDVNGDMSWATNNFTTSEVNLEVDKIKLALLTGEL